jgi:hypothetical protein
LNVSFDPFLQIRKPKLENLELIFMKLTTEFMGIHSEYQLFRGLKNTFLDGLMSFLSIIKESVFSFLKLNVKYVEMLNMLNLK